MNESNPEPALNNNPAGLVDRAKNILMNSKEEWSVVASEAPNVGGIITGYVIPLSLIPAVATFLALTVVGGSVGMAFGIGQAILALVVAIVGVLLSAAIINALSGTFDSRNDFGRALQLVAYASTPSWVLGILNIIPGLNIVVALGAMVWSVYLFYLGLNPVMLTPKGKEVGYMIVSAIILVVVYFVLFFVLGLIFVAIFGLGAASSVMYR
ncbi:MAG: YIP1 family protein [Ignavibacteriae bacterium]|nr:YIP1 family protein [Ignavibacteriota bacterium]MCB9216370.1 YIP1 family protein [Ignavibacteria bacterium]